MLINLVMLRRLITSYCCELSLCLFCIHLSLNWTVTGCTFCIRSHDLTVHVGSSVYLWVGGKGVAMHASDEFSSSLQSFGTIASVLRQSRTRVFLHSLSSIVGERRISFPVCLTVLYLMLRNSAGHCLAIWHGFKQDQYLKTCWQLWETGAFPVREKLARQQQK